MLVQPPVPLPATVLTSFELSIILRSSLEASPATKSAVLLTSIEMPYTHWNEAAVPVPSVVANVFEPAAVDTV